MYYLYMLSVLYKCMRIIWVYVYVYGGGGPRENRP